MRMRNRRKVGVLMLAALCLLVSPCVQAWGEEGHRFINRVAAQHLPADIPSFVRTGAKRLSFLGPEPDRWRDPTELYYALSEVNGPDHFIDIERPQDFEALPNDRYKYQEWLRARGKDPKLVGFLPYAILENFQRVEVSFRLWRDPKNAAERDQIEQTIVYHAGVLGHYIADGSQPLHTTIHYDGWSTSWNPDLFTREPLHWRFESEFVRAQIKIEDFDGLVKPAERLPDPFSDIMKFLFESYSHVPELYRMERTARWDANNSNPASKQYVAGRLAAGAQMLANLWYTAWVDSAMPVSGNLGDK